MPVINAGGGRGVIGGSGGGGGGVDSPGEPSLCAGCGSKIVDRYYLLAVDRQWHSQCLKCCECKLRLDSELTCFARDGNIYCKDDYYRFFAVKRCGRCHMGISSNELVMRARDLVYHLHCFSCASCNKALTKGEQFGMKDNMVYCRHHYETLHLHHLHHHHHHHSHLVADYGTNIVGGAASAANSASAVTTNDEDTSTPGLYVRSTPPPGHPPGHPSGHHHHHHHQHQGTAGGRMTYYNGVGTVQKGRPRKKKVMDNQPEVHNISGLGPGQTLDLLGGGGSDLCNLESGGGNSYDTNPSTPNSSSTGGGQSQARTKRMRTSFKHHQLRTMKSYFALNQNPDAKDLKQLAQKTGLSKRVLQVWFQNARAKWRRNMIRQEGQLGEKGPSSVDATNVTDLVSGVVGGGVGGVGGGQLGAPLSTTPSSMGDISAGTLTSDSQSPPSLTFGDLY